MLMNTGSIQTADLSIKKTNPPAADWDTLPHIIGSCSLWVGAISHPALSRSQPHSGLFSSGFSRRLLLHRPHIWDGDSGEISGQREPRFLPRPCPGHWPGRTTGSAVLAGWWHAFRLKKMTLLELEMNYTSKMHNIEIHSPHTIIF